MKKLFAFFLAVFMIASMSVTVFAEANVGEHGESATIVVGGDFQPTGAIYKTISVDIEWDDMTFAYIKTSSGEWDPGSHEYVGGVEGAWSEETRTITVTNHSDTELTATLSFEQLVDITGVFSSTGEMSSLLELDSAVGTSRDEAPSVSEEFGIIGGEPLEENTSIGMITVYIEAPEGTVTEGPMITAATLSGDATLVNDTTYQVQCTYERQTNTVGLTLTGENMDMIVGQNNYVVGFMAADGSITGRATLGDYTYNEAENTLSGDTVIQFVNGSLRLVYSSDAGASWIKLPVILQYSMKVVISDVGLSATTYTNNMIEEWYKVIWYEDTQTYKIRHNAAKHNTELEFWISGNGIQYMTSSVTIVFKNSDGTVVEEVSCYKGGSTLRYPNVVEGETLSIWYYYDGKWVDTGKKVVYDIYFSISDYS